MKVVVLYQKKPIAEGVVEDKRFKFKDVDEDVLKNIHNTNISSFGFFLIDNNMDMYMDISHNPAVCWPMKGELVGIVENLSGGMRAEIIKLDASRYMMPIINFEGGYIGDVAVTDGGKIALLVKDMAAEMDNLLEPTLSDVLKQDILNRYENEEYYDKELINEYTNGFIRHSIPMQKMLLNRMTDWEKRTLMNVVKRIKKNASHDGENQVSEMADKTIKLIKEAM